MSMRLVCDCECHEQDYYDSLRPLQGEDYTTFADRDICGECLMQCRRWRPYVEGTRVISGLSASFDAIYTPVIEESLKSQLIFHKRFNKQEGR
jgi:hypothetical protein